MGQRRYPPLKQGEVLAILSALGFVKKRQDGSHAQYEVAASANRPRSIVTVDLAINEWPVALSTARPSIQTDPQGRDLPLSTSIAEESAEAFLAGAAPQARERRAVPCLWRGTSAVSRPRASPWVSALVRHAHLLQAVFAGGCSSCVHESLAWRLTPIVEWPLGIRFAPTATCDLKLNLTTVCGL